MTPKEKAKELVDKYLNVITSSCHHDSYCERKECQYKDIIICCTTQNEAKQCALIAVEEVLNSGGIIKFWNEVKKEIEAL